MEKWQRIKMKIFGFYVNLEFKKQDCWIGFYWNSNPEPRPWFIEHNLWICILPTLPIHFHWITMAGWKKEILRQNKKIRKKNE